MPKRMRSRRPRRRPARRSRIPRGVRGVPRAQMKHYNYTFHLQPQAILSNYVAPGSTGPAVIINPNPGSTPPGIGRQLPIGAVTVTTNDLGLTALVDWSTACTHSLNDIQEFSAYTAMYDAYKINSVTATLEYLNNSSAVNGSGTLPTFYMYWDQDDAVYPLSIKQISGKTGRRVFTPTSSRLKTSMRYTPRTQNVVEGPASGGAVPVVAVVANKSQWIDCVNPNVPHYAFKLYCQDWLAALAPTIYNVVRIRFSYNVSFRSPLLTS